MIAVAPRELAIWAITIASGLLIYWKKYGRDIPKAPAGAPPVSKTEATVWNFRSVLLRMAVGAVVTMLCVTGSVLWRRRDEDHPGVAPGYMGGLLTFAAVTGALIGFFLTVRDLVDERRAKGQRVPFVLSAYYERGLASAVLWVASSIIAALAAIICLQFVLSIVQRLLP
jgi:hypothetical protein